jgi:predicted ArsR family transcriptional regulator
MVASPPPSGEALPLMDWLALVADPIRLRIVVVLSEVEQASAADLAALGEVSGPTLRRHLSALVALGVVEQRRGESDGQTPGRPPAQFVLPARIRDSVRAVLAVLAGRRGAMSAT